LPCAGFDRAFTQSLEVAGTLGTLRTDDFVIPRDEHKCRWLSTTFLLAVSRSLSLPKVFPSHAALLLMSLVWPPFCSYTVTSQHGLLAGDTYDATLRENFVAKLDRPQARREWGCGT
jgi:hypothetical protein